MMPEMNGIELLEKIKADPLTREIPVIMLTNLSGKTESDNALSKGAEQYLVKSEYEPKQIVKIVEDILARYP
jgi:CheY-like chemotaxis protein